MVLFHQKKCLHPFINKLNANRNLRKENELCFSQIEIAANLCEVHRPKSVFFLFFHFMLEKYLYLCSVDFGSFSHGKYS